MCAQDVFNQIHMSVSLRSAEVTMKCNQTEVQYECNVFVRRPQSNTINIFTVYVHAYKQGFKSYQMTLVKAPLLQ